MKKEQDHFEVLRKIDKNPNFSQRQLAEKLGFSLANTIAITSPKMIVLFGGLAQSGDLLIKPTKKYMEKYVLSIFKNKIEIVPSKLNASDAAILGASALAWKH